MVKKILNMAEYTNLGYSFFINPKKRSKLINAMSLISMIMSVNNKINLIDFIIKWNTHFIYPIKE